jgi:hypothetical protein
MVLLIMQQIYFFTRCTHFFNESVYYTVDYNKQEDATPFGFIYFGSIQWCRYEYIKHTLILLEVDVSLKGQCHEIFCFWFFS